MEENVKVNHLLKSEYLARWINKTDQELEDLQDTIVEKMNTVRETSPTVYDSLHEVLKLLESYMTERNLLK